MLNIFIKYSSIYFFALFAGRMFYRMQEHLSIAILHFNGKSLVKGIKKALLGGPANFMIGLLLFCEYQ